jgi:hypothetical protein
LNAGDCWLIPGIEPGIWMLLPLTFGSGKLGSPCERMQVANASAPASLLFPVRLLLLLGPGEPQAAIAIAQLTAASALGMARRPVLADLLWLALRTVTGLLSESLDGGSPG